MNGEKVKFLILGLATSFSMISIASTQSKIDELASNAQSYKVALKGGPILEGNEVRILGEDYQFEYTGTFRDSAETTCSITFNGHIGSGWTSKNASPAGFFTETMIEFRLDSLKDSTCAKSFSKGWERVLSGKAIARGENMNEIIDKEIFMLEISYY